MREDDVGNEAEWGRLAEMMEDTHSHHMFTCICAYMHAYKHSLL